MKLFDEMNAAIPTIRSATASGEELLNAVEHYAGIITSISHPIRLALLAYIRSNGPSSLAQLHDHFPMKRSVINHHLGLMSDRYLLVKQRKGREVFYAINNEVLKFIQDYLDRAFGNDA